MENHRKRKEHLMAKKQKDLTDKHERIGFMKTTYYYLE
jgi:hypothetical protein